MKLMIINDGPASGAVNMQTDLDLLESHKPGDNPILRIYSWSPFSVSYGYHQKTANFNQTEIESNGYGFVRRATGGRAILHAEELTYAIVGTSPSELFGNNLHDTYMLINQALILFLQKLELQPDISIGETLSEARASICFKSAGKHEITVDSKKIIGSAQRRKNGVFLQHGSILCGSAHAKLSRLLNDDAPGKLHEDEIKKITTNLYELSGVDYKQDYKQLSELLINSFSVTLGLNIEVV
jgi:lipoyl(octanoyl) transferase